MWEFDPTPSKRDVDQVGGGEHLCLVDDTWVILVTTSTFIHCQY